MGFNLVGESKFTLYIDICKGGCISSLPSRICTATRNRIIYRNIKYQCGRLLWLQIAWFKPWSAYRCLSSSPNQLDLRWPKYFPEICSFSNIANQSITCWRNSVKVPHIVSKNIHPEQISIVQINFTSVQFADVSGNSLTKTWGYTIWSTCDFCKFLNE